MHGNPFQGQTFHERLFARRSFVRIHLGGELEWQRRIVYNPLT